MEMRRKSAVEQIRSTFWTASEKLMVHGIAAILDHPLRSSPRGVSAVGSTVIQTRPEKELRHVTNWHPILAAVEGPTGTWRMVDPHGHEYGRVEIRRLPTGDHVLYKAIHAGELIGWATTLRVACLKVHLAFLSSLRPGGAPAADWGELTGNGRRGD